MLWCVSGIHGQYAVPSLCYGSRFCCFLSFFGVGDKMYNGQFTISHSGWSGASIHDYSRCCRHTPLPKRRGDIPIFIVIPYMLGPDFDSSVSCKESGAESDGRRDDLVAEGRGVAAGEATVNFKVGARYI